ncbi:hypothetical protein TNCV_3360911 [Trichonephila clavipes]|nr:hypothetical protein TNCV_3360911 [Trichonephila clavipes]
MPTFDKCEASSTPSNFEIFSAIKILGIKKWKWRELEDYSPFLLVCPPFNCRKGRLEMGSIENGYRGAVCKFQFVKERIGKLESSPAKTNYQGTGASYGYWKECKNQHSST